MILVGRRDERLQELAGELSRQGVEATTLAVDLADPAGLGQVLEAIARAEPLDYLVNNAGFTIIGAFDSVPLERQMGMVRVHIDAALALVHQALPAMKSAGRGCIVNVSSMCNFTPYTDVAVYGASKAFLTSFSGALSQELSGSGVQVQCLVPGFTHTELHEREAFDDYETPEVPEEMWMLPEQVVAESLGALDSGQATVVTVAGAVNRASAEQALQRDLDSLRSTQHGVRPYN